MIFEGLELQYSLYLTYLCVCVCMCVCVCVCVCFCCSLTVSRSVSQIHVGDDIRPSDVEDDLETSCAYCLDLLSVGLGCNSCF